ncbi:elmo ced-12 family protein [Mucor ambiguus]|uniref:Elmo ced-12 family protein n=1 Tax=Mucor ambiguus TaxID=91626 RepID=A0A0C9MMU2_9FUNG|nr:elmo ced-12 family protein [Mucor ambiguus]
MSHSYDLDTKPSAQQALNRLSSGFSLSESANHVMTPKDDKSLKIATFSLQGYLKEKDFATEFLERGGLDSLCDIVNTSSGNTLAYALNSFLSLMEHNAGWESLDDEFVAHIAHIVVTEQLATIARPAIAVLLKLVCANESSTSVITCYGYPTLHKAIEKEPELIKTLVDRLLSPEYLLSITSMSLLTAMLKYVTDEYRSVLSSAYDRSNLKKNILKLMKNHPSAELKLMILEYQAVFIQNINMRYGTAVSMHNPRHLNMLNDIWEAAKVDQIDIPGAKKWKKIGFTTELPQREFARTGVFGLEEMHLFVLSNQDLFAKLILEQIHRPEGKRCPFAKASIEVTDLLCSHWNITSTNTIAEFQPLILSFNHVHSTTLQTYFRIFHDMEATTYDLSKVSALVRSQLRSTFASTKDIQEFDRNMFGTPYQQIRDRRLKELEWADDLSGRDAITNLRARLSKQSYEFLKKQRISCLLEGAWFPCPLSNQRMSVIASNSNSNGTLLSHPATNTSTGSSLGITNTTISNNATTGKRWRYYKLSRSKRSIMYGDFSEKIAPVLKSYEKLPNRIDLSSVTEIRPIRKPSIAGLANNSSQIFNSNNSSILSSSSAIHDGNTTHHLLSTGQQGQQQQQQNNLAFALYSDKYTAVAEFYCATPTQTAEWKDGFSMILDKRFTSKETAELFHTLTEVGVKVKLLQIAGDRVEIPHGVVDVPPVPPGLGSGFFYDIIDT